jgi:hypothetical protein
MQKMKTKDTTLLMQGRSHRNGSAPTIFWNAILRNMITGTALLLLVAICFCCVFLSFSVHKGAIAVAREEAANAQVEVRIRDENIDDLRSEIDLLQSELSHTKTHLAIYRAAYEESYQANVAEEVAR